MTSPQKMTQRTIVRLDAERAINLIVQGCRETSRHASMLMAYGLNTAQEAPDASFHLPGFIQPVDAPRELSPEELSQFRTAYEAWVVANGFRELLEGIEVFLNSFHKILMKAELHLRRVSITEAKKRDRDFNRKGVSGKIHSLEQSYGFKTGFSHYFRTLTQARNCLTHRRGVVGDEDCENSQHLQLQWLGFEGKIIESDGTVHLLTLDTLGPFHGSEFSQSGDATLEVTMVDRFLTVPKGGRIVVPPRSLQEICSMTSYTCEKFRQLLLNWLLSQGVIVNGGQPIPDPIASISIEAYSLQDEQT